MEDIPDKLESPQPRGPSGWSGLYRARGEDVSKERPIFTGDVFQLDTDDSQAEYVQVVQHPCALRIDGVKLSDRMLVVEAAPRPSVAEMSWSGSYKLMPLPDLVPAGAPVERHFAASFDQPVILAVADLVGGSRLACLSQPGVNLLMQRWVHHNSRTVVKTFEFQKVTSAQFEEADLIEEWCEGRDDVELASYEAVAWLREEVSEKLTRQDLLQDVQQRSEIRQAMRQHLRGLEK